MITKRLVPVEAYQDEHGPVCRLDKAKCMFLVRGHLTGRLSCFPRDHEIHDMTHHKFRPGPWCPVWYGESKDGGVYAKLKEAMPDTRVLEVIMNMIEENPHNNYIVLKLNDMATKIREVKS